MTTPTHVRALVVDPDITVPSELVSVDVRGPLVLQTLVRGWLEIITPRPWGPAAHVLGEAALAWHAYLNEEGKLHGMPANTRAITLAIVAGWQARDVLVGPVVFLGNGSDGDEADVPHELVALAERMWGRGSCVDRYVRRGAGS